jgi:hemoglobin-like flavoprotein
LNATSEVNVVQIAVIFADSERMMQSSGETVSPQALKDVFLQSLDRCGKSSGFLSDFYARFIGRSPTVRAKFAKIDLEKQAIKLFDSLRILGLAVSGQKEGLKELAARAETHNRQHLNITPDMYELWQEAMLISASEHDPEWSPEIEFAWEHTLEIVVNYMIKRY